MTAARHNSAHPAAVEKSIFFFFSMWKSSSQSSSSASFSICSQSSSHFSSSFRMSSKTCFLWGDFLCDAFFFLLFFIILKSSFSYIRQSPNMKITQSSCNVKMKPQREYACKAGRKESAAFHSALSSAFNQLTLRISHTFSGKSTSFQTERVHLLLYSHCLHAILFA